VILVATPAQAAALIVSDSLTDRFGAFTVIVLGETLTGVVAGLSGEPVSGIALAVGLVAVVVGFGAWWTYFDFAGGRRAARATGPRPRARASAQHPLGIRGRPPPGRRRRPALPVTLPAHPDD
jgi:low temperature requirement protein LtrA